MSPVSQEATCGAPMSVSGMLLWMGSIGWDDCGECWTHLGVTIGRREVRRPAGGERAHFSSLGIRVTVVAESYCVYLSVH